MGCRDFSDGIYRWPEGFVHYVEKHSVKPPEDFIEHVRRAAVTPPPRRTSIRIKSST